MVHENFATTHTYFIKMNRYTNIYLSLQNSGKKPQGSVVLLVGNVTVINVANYSH
jgi:hypothetical protein